MVTVHGYRRPSSSMNEANERDPFNNNCYGTLVDRAYKMVNLPVLDVDDFNERIIRGYEEGYGEKDLPADLSVARSLIPAGTATLRDFSYIAPEIPEYIPRTAPAAWTASPSAPTRPSSARCSPRTSWKQKLRDDSRGRPRDVQASSGRRPRSTTTAGKKKAATGGMFDDHHRPQQVQGLRRVRHRLRRQRPQDDPQDRGGDDRASARATASSRTSARRTRSTSTTTCSST